VQEIAELEETIAAKELEEQRLAARRRELESRLANLLGKPQHFAA